MPITSLPYVVPTLATDCHFHIFGPRTRYPFCAGRAYDPAEASCADYRAMADRLGMHRMIIVQPSPYGTDNSCMLDSLSFMGRDRARGIAVIDNNCSDEQLEIMHEAGVRGIRFNALSGGTQLDQLEPLAARIASYGWHIQLWIEGAHLAELEGRLAALPVDVCIDHMGQINVHQWADDQGFKCLSRLLVAGRTWIKLCGYRASQAGPPYADLQAPARALIESAPNRCVWGTDWPHPMLGNSPMPDDVNLLLALMSWVRDESDLERILVKNPAHLYGF